jgi:transcriptional regulator with XRE-family HTH domain
MSIGKVIKFIRINLDMERETLAEKVNVSRLDIERIESNNKRLNHGLLVKIAEALSTDISTLVLIAERGVVRGKSEEE